MIREDLHPSAILTEASFRNALAVSLAVSGSVNVLRHLAGIAAEAGLDLDFYAMLDQLGDRVPQLVTVKPCGPHSIADLERAGGTLRVLHALRDLLDLGAGTVAGAPLGAVLDMAPADGEGEGVIASLAAPALPGPSVMILRGSLAPGGAVLKQSDGSRGRNLFEGPAMVFESQEAALDALAAGRIAPGSAVVLRGLGARGGPGVASASWFVAALSGSGLAGEVCVLTDGQLSGLNHGLVIGQVCPEAAEGGPIGLVRNGDPLRIDLVRRRADLMVEPGEMERRRQAPRAQPAPETKGWLALYQRSVGPLPRGATIAAPRNFASSDTDPEYPVYGESEFW